MEFNVQIRKEYNSPAEYLNLIAKKIEENSDGVIGAYCAPYGEDELRLYIFMEPKTLQCATLFIQIQIHENIETALKLPSYSIDLPFFKSCKEKYDLKADTFPELFQVLQRALDTPQAIDFLSEYWQKAKDEQRRMASHKK